MKFIVERNIPFIEGLLEPFAEVIYLESEDINADVVRDVDAILVRTRTQCNEQLLRGSKCTFVGTATIGLDHIDRDWCAANGIEAVNAPGCNAPAVAQYVLASVMQLINRPVSQYTIGIVGVGHVGSIVERWARALGMKVMLCDPPRQEKEGDSQQWSTLHQLAEHADIITFHTPLSRSGNHPSYHLADDTFFRSLRRQPIVINSARGPVTDTEAFIRAIDSGLVGKAVIDCWEGEPMINLDLLKRASIATPHIAGYSLEGKIRATRMVLDSLCRHFGLPHIKLNVTEPADAPEKVNAMSIVKSYNPMADMKLLTEAPRNFENLRNYYALRHEPLAGKID